MKRLLPFRRFVAELADWSWRVGACAVWSFSCAYASGFNSFAAVTGMLAGIASWVFVLAWCSSRRPACGAGRRDGFFAALKLTAYLKAAPTLTVFAGVMPLSLLFPSRHSPLIGAAFLPDMITSVTAYALASPFVRWGHLGVLDGRDEFAWIVLATVINGALIFALIALLAWPVQHALRWWARRSGGGESSAGRV